MTLADIAAKFGISTTTVSMCLGGRSARYGIRPELAEKIIAFARSNGYQPNRSASRLRRREKNPPLGIIFTYESGLSKISMPLRSIVAYLEKNGREYTLMGLRNSHIGETMSVLRSMGTKDVLVLGRLRELTPEEMLDPLYKPFLEDWNVAWKLLDDGMRLYASDYIFPLPPRHAEKNFIRVGFNTHEVEKNLLSRIKTAGLGPVAVYDRWTLREKSLIPEFIDSPEMILPYKETTDRFTDGLERVPRILELWKERGLRTVFLSNDYVAAGMMRGLLDAGVRIPEDIGVIGFGNCDAAPYFSRPLSTVGSACGDRALDLVRSICGELPSFPDNTVLEYTFFERESFKFNSTTGRKGK